MSGLEYLLSVGLATEFFETRRADFDHSGFSALDIHILHIWSS